MLRSVHRESIGRVIEPRKRAVCGSRRGLFHGRQHSDAGRQRALESRRGQRAGHVDEGSSRNLGDPFFSAYKRPEKGKPEEKVLA